MAKVIGNILFTGMVEGLCFYRQGGQVYVRRASRLTGKKVKTDKAFAQTMVHARLLGRASRIASMVYQSLPDTFREYWMFRAFTGEALDLLRQGKSYDEAAAILWHIYASVWADKEKEQRQLLKQETATVANAGENVLGLHKKMQLVVLPSAKRHRVWRVVKPGWSPYVKD